MNMVLRTFLENSRSLDCARDDKLRAVVEGGAEVALPTSHKRLCPFTTPPPLSSRAQSRDLLLSKKPPQHHIHSVFTPVLWLLPAQRFASLIADGVAASGRVRYSAKGVTSNGIFSRGDSSESGRVLISSS